ncbi:MAG: HAD family phosphatase [Chitinophagaceae bacterium]|nr:HAD family phosphatase [Chitinophagaceae bacterium]
MINTKKAFLFDLNGTMIDDMSYHIRAWHRILNELGANISMERMKEECYGKNNELLERMFPGRFSEEEKNRMSFEKEKQYQQEFKPHLQLLPGLPAYLEQAYQSGIKMAIGSAAIMFNIDFVLDNLKIRHYFDAIISADDVVESKPNPETYLACATLLNISPEDCVVFEDAPKGVESALNAGMQSVVITLMHEKEDFFQYPNVIRCIKNYTELMSENI